MITVCAWAKDSPIPCAPHWLLADTGVLDGKVSHGICWAHAQYMREKLERAGKKDADAGPIRP